MKSKASRTLLIGFHVLWSVLPSRGSLLCAFLLLAEGATLHAAFNDDFTSARALGMGEAYTAIAQEGDSLLINAAGISRISVQQLAVTHATLYAGLDDGTSIQQQLASYVVPQSTVGALGFLWKRLAVSALYSENMYAVAYARRFLLLRGTDDASPPRLTLSLGGVARLMRWDAAPTVGPRGEVLEDLKGPWTATVDLGALVIPSETTTLALAVQNLTRPSLVSEEAPIEERLPIRSRLGLAVRGNRLLWDLDLLFQPHQLDLRTGVEWELIPERVMVRFGVQLQSLAWGTNITFGGGYYPSGQFRIDYAFLQPIQGLETPWGSHRISLTYEF